MRLLCAAFLVVASVSWVSQRLMARLVVLPVMSVAVLAWLSGNPFNGLTFTVVAALLLGSTANVPRPAVAAAAGWWALAGGTLIALGWFYPHFLVTDTWVAYTYASPFGLLPCPTLSVIVGLTLVWDGPRSIGWNVVVAAAGLLYGGIGVFALGVVLDVGLLAGSTLLAARILADLVVGRVLAAA